MIKRPTLAFGQSWLEGNAADPTLFVFGGKGIPTFRGASYLNGILSTILLVILIILILIFRKKLTKLVSTNKFWYIYGGVCIPFFVGGRFIPFIIQSARAPQGTWTHDMLFQNIFSTNLCAFLLVITSIIICVPKFRNWAGKIISPWIFLGTVLSIIGLAMSTSANNFFMYLFFKQSVPWGLISGNNPGGEVYDSYQYFSSHAWLLVTAILILMSVKEYKLIHIAYSIASIFIYSIYVGIAIGFSKLSNIPIQHDTGGILPADWQTSAQNMHLNAKGYPGLFKVINVFKLSGAGASVFGLFLFLILGSSIAFAQHRFITYRGQETKFNKPFIKSYNWITPKVVFIVSPITKICKEIKNKIKRK